MKRHNLTWATSLGALIIGALCLCSCEFTGGMVLVAPNATVGTTTAFYIDKYENSLREKKKRNSDGDFDTILVAESRANTLPQSAVNYTEAKEYCENAEKRLCTKKEWLTACVGPTNLKSGVQASPTSPSKIDGSCNVNKDPEKTTTLVLKAGSKSACATKDIPVFDMIGNLAEWVSSDDDGYSIGPSAVSTLALSVCNSIAGFDTDGDGDPDVVYDESNNASEMGFRCCSTTAP